MIFEKKVTKKKSHLIKKEVNILSQAELHDVILKPITTEKTAILREDIKSKKGVKVVVFKVLKRATKIEIKKSLKLIYNVSALKINILNTATKPVFRNQIRGLKKSYKKAIVFLSDKEISKIK